MASARAGAANGNAYQRPLSACAQPFRGAVERPAHDEGLRRCRVRLLTEILDTHLAHS